MNLWSPYSRYEWIKVLYLTISFFCIVASYTVLREIRDVLFVSLVGCEYVQYVQILSMLFLIPALFLYAMLVDRLKKHQLLYAYTCAYAVGCFLMAICVIHPTIGLTNSHASVLRTFGWIQYLFIEGYAPFVISLFMAFVNSVTSPAAAPRSYSIIIAGSKLGGIALALFSWWFLGSSLASDRYLISGLLLIAAFLLLMVPFCIKLLVGYVPESLMHGYEASYEFDKLHVQDKTALSSRVVSGLTMMFRYPYAFGIFMLVFFWEIISVILNYKRLGFCVGISKSVLGLSSMLFLQIFWVHVVGFFIALIATRPLLNRIGERWSLIVVPFLTSLFIGGYFLTAVPEFMMICFVLVRGINFSLSISVREILYIPTTKEVRFKTKSWIDAFGAKFARGTGSFYSLMVERFASAGSHTAYLVLCLTVSGLWMIMAYALGRRYEKAIAANEVIG